MNSKWTSFTKSRIAPCLKYFHAFVSTLNYMSLPHMLVQTVTEEKLWWGTVWQRTIRSESTQDKAGPLPPASRDYIMLFAIFLELKRFSASSEFQKKKTGPVLLFKTIFWHWYFFPTNKIQDIQQPDNYETDSDNVSDEEAVYGRTCMTRSGRSVQDKRG